MTKKKTGRGSGGYIIVAIFFIGSFSLLFSERVESKTQAAILFDNSAYETGENIYKQSVKRTLEQYGCYYSGLNLTRIVEITGGREYRIEIYNEKFAEMSQLDMEQLTQEINALSVQTSDKGKASVDVVFIGDNLP